VHAHHNSTLTQRNIAALHQSKPQIDDTRSPAHARAGLCGIWGVLFVGLLGKEQYIVEVYGKPAGAHLMGVFYGGHGQLLLCQFIAVIVIIAWTGALLQDVAAKELSLSY
jgi:Amt family ammonium transporter